jgi:acetoin utilization deacetylase AcuC-like enzyme
LKRTAFISHPDCRLHALLPGHPECPERLDAIAAQLAADGLVERLAAYDAPIATTAQLEAVHEPGYVRRIFERAPAHGLVELDPDTYMGPHTLTAALRAAGAVVLATDLVLAGEVDTAFCNVRPPGHHAERAQAMGFCVFNNIAVGAAHALRTHGLQRVAIIDFDVHHGNGTEEIFRNEPRVLMCSTYQYPLYPYIVGAMEPGHMINVPLSPGAGSAALRAAVTEQWLPELERFAPQIIFVSAGFDAHRDDPLASLTFTDADFQWVTATLLEVADRHAGGRMVCSLEGGYALGALGRSAAACTRALLGVA